ncbi:hypothetical protein KKI24_03545 [bacterium]|nr:hypothetical protein [bacterium]
MGIGCDRKKALWMVGLLLVLFSLVAEAAIPEAPAFFISNLEDQRFWSRKVSEPIVISFFFVDCLVCRKEIPELYRFLKTHHPHVRLLFIDPLGTDTASRIRELARTLNVPSACFYQDGLGTIALKYGVNNIFPTIIGIRQGRIVFRFNTLSEDNRRLMAKHLN